MPAYMVVEVNYHDGGWTEAYRREVPAMITSYGGRYLALSRPPDRLEGAGKIPETIAIVEFPTMAIMKAFMASAEYAPHAKARQAGADTWIYLLEGIPGT